MGRKVRKGRRVWKGGKVVGYRSTRPCRSPGRLPKRSKPRMTKASFIAISKPANIKVTPDGKVKVLDFGLAKADGAGNRILCIDDVADVDVQAMTHAGVILGTAAYMSPEQAAGKPVDRRTDIWAFGCVLFEMLTGRHTFAGGDTVSDAVASILKNDPVRTGSPPTRHP